MRISKHLFCQNSVLLIKIKIRIFGRSKVTLNPDFIGKPRTRERLQSLRVPPCSYDDGMDPDSFGKVHDLNNLSVLYIPICL